MIDLCELMEMERFYSKLVRLKEKCDEEALEDYRNVSIPNWFD